MTIFVTSGSVATVVYACTGTVKAAEDGTLIDQGGVVPSIDQILQQLAGKVSKSGDTMTGDLSIAGGSAPGYFMRRSDGTPIGALYSLTSSGRVVLRGYNSDATHYNGFLIPDTSNVTVDADYNILTSKTPVTVAQGGTGMSAPASGTITWESGITTAEMTLYKFGRIAVLNGRITLASQVTAYGTLGTFPAGFAPAASVVNFLIETPDGSFYAAYSGTSGTIRNRVAMPAQGYIINLVYVTSA